MGHPPDMYDPQTWNAYSYVRNSPLNLTDPTGLAASCTSLDGDHGCSDDTPMISGNAFADAEFAQSGEDPPQDPPPISKRPPIRVTTNLHEGWCQTSDRECQQQLGRILDDLRWGKAFAKSFFSPSEQIKEWKPGGCVAVAVDAFLDGGILPDGPPGFGPDDAVKQGAATAAMARIVGRGLVTPLRSRFVQNAVKVGEAADGAAAVDLFARSLQGLIAESTAMKAGTCR